MVVMQHKCIEPLGESKSITGFSSRLAHRLGLGMYYSEGMSELDWVQRMFEASDLPRMSWRKFLRKDTTVPAPPERLRGRSRTVVQRRAQENLPNLAATLRVQRPVLEGLQRFGQVRIRVHDAQTLCAR